MKKNKKILLSLLALSLIIPGAVYAEGENESVSTDNEIVERKTIDGITTLEADTIYENSYYVNEKDTENVIVVSNDMASLYGCDITKKGNASSNENGVNAAVLNNNGTFSVDQGAITTNGTYAPALYVAGNGDTFINKTKVSTTADNSNGIMNFGDGKITATDLELNTTGKNSSAIYGGGLGRIFVTNGTYTTTGTNSPAIYSKGDILVKEATLKSENSEGVVLYGAGAVTLDGVTLVTGNSTTSGIYLQKGSSSDIETSTLNVSNSNITINSGDTLFVENTLSVINFENSTVTNKNGKLLKIKADSSEGNDNINFVTLFLNNEKIRGDIEVTDNVSLSVNIDKESIFESNINKENKNAMIFLTISKNSTFALTEDTYVTSLTNEEESNSNIYANGHKLYVNGEEVSINQEKYVSKVDTEKEGSSKTVLYISILVGVILVAAAGIIVFLKKVK